MKTNNLLFLFLMFTMLLPMSELAQISSGGGFSIEKSVVANGGGTSSSVEFSVIGTTGQNAAGAKPFLGTFSHQSGFWVNELYVPTAAAVLLSGKVKTANGRGIRNAVITLTDQNGTRRTILTGTFGIFRFTDVEVGQTYILTVFSKRFAFASPSQTISPTEDLTEIEFISQN